MSQTKGASAGREWTEQETLLLLEVSLYLSFREHLRTC